MKKALTIGLFSLGLILISVYGVRAVKTYLVLRHVEESVENPVKLKGWMTVPYLSKTHQIPKDYLYQAINVPAEGNDSHSLHYFRKHYYEDNVETLLLNLQHAIADYNTGTR